MTSRKQPSAVFWVAVVIAVVLMTYPLSWGPAWWIVSRLSARELMPQSVADGLWTFYGPLRSEAVPSSVKKARNWYRDLLLPVDGFWP
jgi:hypothetical protein